MSEGVWGYKSLRAQGRCGWCGGKPIDGKSLCERCSKRAQKKNAEWRARKAGAATNGHLGRFSSARLSRFGRCKCGLLLPCTSCLPTVRDLAESRPGAE